jgi:inosine triphosphate pyrophosphatase
MKTPIFVTGNQDKADYLARLLEIPLEHQKLHLDEIQSMSLDEIVGHKVKQAFEIVGKPVLVEDVALGCAVLGNLPGPFVKFFVDAEDGLERMCRMLDGFSDRSARAECVFGYYNGEHLRYMRGGLSGTIADHPRGEGGYGWDRIFCPDGYDGKTRAELTPEQNEATYQVIKPIALFRDFLNSDEPL